MDLICGNDFKIDNVTPDKVLALQNELFKLPQAEIITEHTFLPNVYERKITIPPWVVLTGAEHKTPYRVRLEKGTIAVNTENGVKVLMAPCEFEASAGMQRAGRVFEDEVVWVDVYENFDNCTDIATLEHRLYVVPECGLGDSRTEIQKAQIAYRAFLYQLGLSTDDVDNATKSIFTPNKFTHNICDVVANKMQHKGK